MLLLLLVAIVLHCMLLSFAISINIFFTFTLIQFILERGDPRLQQSLRLEERPLGEVRQRDLAAQLLMQQLINILVHVQQRPAGRAAHREFVPVVVQGLEESVHVDWAAHEPHVEEAERPEVPAARERGREGGKQRLNREDFSTQDAIQICDISVRRCTHL